MTNPEPATEQVLNTATEPAVLGPLTRWMRTIVQVAIALAAAVPTLAALFNVSAETSAKLTGGMAALVALVSGLHNAFNAKTTPTDDEGQIGLEQVLVIVVLVILVIVLLRNV